MVILQTPDVQRRNSEVYYEDMTELTTFGERVSWLLRRRRLADQPIASQKELAAHIGMKPQQLNAYMNGRRTAIEAEQSTKTQLTAAADAAKQRGSRADLLAEIAASGAAILTTEDTAFANAWLRRRVRVFVRDNQPIEVRFNFW